MKKHLPLLVFILSIYNLSAQNLITNGDFGLFNAAVPSPAPLGYTTTYTQIPYNGTAAFGVYSITNNPQPLALAYLFLAYDISEGIIGNGTGNMMYVDGKNNQVFWQQDHPALLEAGKKNTFAFIKAVKSGQYDDDYTPSVRMLFDDEIVKENPNKLIQTEKQKSI